MDKYAQQALLEYNSEETSPHPGGIDGRPFWNINSSQFTFAPKIQFPNIPGAKKYLYTAEDEKGNTYSFVDKSPMASLAPIWGDIPTGITTLTVKAINRQEKVFRISGVRTFFKCDPFPGREALPPKAKNYRESALNAFRFTYNDPMVQYWLEHGEPKPDYPHNVYPAKTISSIIDAMIMTEMLHIEDPEGIFFKE